MDSDLSMLLLFLSGLAAKSGLITNFIVIFACLAVSRSFFGIFGSGANPAAQAYVADRTSQAERRDEIAFISSGFSVGTVVGPAFAAALVAFAGILSPLLLTSVIAAIMSAMIWFRLPEQKEPVTDAARLDVETNARGLWHSSAKSGWFSSFARPRA